MLPEGGAMIAHQVKIRIVAEHAAEKLTGQRMSVLQLALALGSVSAACRRMSIDRTSFYDWKRRRSQTHGLDGLKELPPVHKSHPMTTPPEVADRVLALSGANPAWGCVLISDHLQLEGVSLSSPTVQSILITSMGSEPDTSGCWGSRSGWRASRSS